MTIDIRTAGIYPLATLRKRTAGTMTVLTMRKWPRGVKWELIDYWIPDAGPSEMLLAMYQDDQDPVMTWDEFVSDYQGEQSRKFGCTVRTHQTMLSSQLSPANGIAHMAQNKGPLTLLCHEQGDEDTVLCHRQLLAAMVREAAKERVEA